MRTRTKEWMPTSGYELRRRVEIDGKRWTVCFKLHLVSELDAQREDWAGLRLRSTITVWPPDLVEGEQRRIARLGVYRGTQARLKRHGYVGSWTVAPGVGKYADFEKELSGVADLRRESKLLEKLSQDSRSILMGPASDKKR